jgi:hypothetical protein
VFLIGGIWGVAVLTPFYFMFDTIGREAPPPITHPEFYYGFMAVALAWQIAFLVIAADPVRFRLMMPVAVVEKMSYVATIASLYASGRVGVGRFTLGAFADLVLGLLFLAAFLSTRRTARRQH